MEHSRSIGIHPPSMEILHELDIATEFQKEGIEVKQGLAYLDRKHTGAISFESTPTPFNFILTLPQFRTETILQQHIQKSRYIKLIRNASVTHINPEGSHCEISYYHQPSGKSFSINSKLAVASDGKNSFVRNQLNIDFKGSEYPDTYVMADAGDDTEWQSDAAVILHRKGVIESFPLPDSLRRWVVKTPRLIDNPSPDTIRDLIGERFGYFPKMDRLQMISSFGVQKYLAQKFRYKRVLLAGDAAHVLSPIGGQGMNLGWLDAYNASTAITKVLTDGKDTHLSDYERQRKKEALLCMRRASFNMRLGRKRNGLALATRNFLVYNMLKPHIAKSLARRFTMRDRNRLIV